MHQNVFLMLSSFFHVVPKCIFIFFYFNKFLGSIAALCTWWFCVVLKDLKTSPQHGFLPFRRPSVLQRKCKWLSRDSWALSRPLSATSSWMLDAALTTSGGRDLMATILIWTVRTETSSTRFTTAVTEWTTRIHMILLWPASRMGQPTTGWPLYLLQCTIHTISCRAIRLLVPKPEDVCLCCPELCA